MTRARRTSAASCMPLEALSHRTYLGHEPARALRVDRIPRASVDLEIRAHDRAVRDRQEILDVARLDAGVREDRRLVPAPSLRLADRVDRWFGSGHRP